MLAQFWHKAHGLQPGQRIIDPDQVQGCHALIDDEPDLHVTPISQPDYRMVSSSSRFAAG